MAKLTPLKAIRKHCLWCQGNSSKWVAECNDYKCPLHTLRLGHSVKGERPLKAIRKFCLHCVGTATEVRTCSPDFLMGGRCPLYEYRFGVRPKPAQKLKKANDKGVELHRGEQLILSDL